MNITKEELKKEIVKAFEKHLKTPHYKVFFFGSRVNGKADERSDIDIGIEAGEEIPVSAFFDIKEDLDNLPILQKIDLVDFAKVSAGFKKVALENTEVIYER